MGTIVSEGLKYIGRIDENGYVFDVNGHCTSCITTSGYIISMDGTQRLGKIEKDGTILDGMGEAVGHIEADGYVHLYGERICRIDSDYLKKITPDAWNYGRPGVHPNRDYSSAGSGGFKWPFSFGTTFKLVLGIALWIGTLCTGVGELGFLGVVATLPICIVAIFVVSFIISAMT